MNRLRQNRLRVAPDDPAYVDKLFLLKAVPPLGAESAAAGIYDQELEGRRHFLARMEHAVAETAGNLLPFERTKKGLPLLSATAIYQTAPQIESGVEEYTRSWLQRSGRNPEAEIELHSDTIVPDGNGRYIAVIPSEGSKHVGFQNGQVTVAREAYQNLSVEEQVSLVNAIGETLYLIHDAQDHENMIEAVPGTPAQQ
jgi:hypothetical protein